MKPLQHRFFFRVSGFLFLLLFLADAGSRAQIPPGYYNSATGLTGTSLQQALHDIIDNHTVVSYNSLWTWFKQTDRKSNGKVWDMYSDIPGGAPPYEYTFVTNQCGSYNSEGDCYNREHSWPASWFNDMSPMYSDIFHLFPTDGYVNNMRGNYPFGEVGTASWTSMNGSRRGTCVSPGYTGVVFEPRDEYKGDFARAYFYMETRYFNEDSNWPGSPMTDGSQLLPWAQTAMLLWHLQDPVSQKEINRNDSIYKNIQHNRNPFIDHPEYAGMIWPQYMPSPGTYTWNVTSGNWSSPSSWTPARNFALTGDILVFDGAVKPACSVTIDFSGVYNAGRVRIMNGAVVNLTGSVSGSVLAIGVTGAASPHLEIGSGSSLTVALSNPFQLSLGSGFSGTISGQITFLNSAHQLTAQSSSSLVFTGSAFFKSGAGFSGTPFGASSPGSVVFSSGSTFQTEAGLPPFGLTAPQSVVVFQPGSNYIHKSTISLSLSGRTYGHLTIDAPGLNQEITAGSLPFIVDNLSIQNVTLIGLDFPGGTQIRGGLFAGSGMLRFNHTGSAVSFIGNGLQSISGSGNLVFGPQCGITISSSSSIVLQRDLVVGKNLQILTGGIFTVIEGKTLTVEGDTGL
jgi:endonuclease I